MKAKIISIIDLKTIKVSSTNYKKHEKYGKYITVTKNYLVETEGKNVAIGQEIEIISSRPISKNKKWKIK
jgi:small subunit ribosomal protein S17